MNHNDRFTFIVLVACAIGAMASLVRTSEQLVVVTDINLRGNDYDNDDGNKSYNLRGGENGSGGCRSVGDGARCHILMLVDWCQDYFYDDDDNEHKDYYVGDQYNFQYEDTSPSPTLEVYGSRLLSEPNYPPTFSDIDISYNGNVNSNDLDENNADVDEDDDSIDTTTATTTDTVEMNTTARTTALPAIVIGFASSIVLCGLFLVASEFLERRKFNKRMETTMIQLPSSDSGSGNLSSQSLKLAAWDGKQFRVISTDSSGSFYGSGADKSNKRIGIHRQIRHEESRSSKEYIPTTAVARVYASSDQSSLYYDEVYPSDEEGEESDHQRHHDQHHYRHCRDDCFSHHHIVTDDTSLTDVSTMTTSLRFDNIDVINTPIYDDDDNNHNSEKITELSDIHRVSDDTKIESLVNLSTIPATKFVSLSSLSPQQQQQQPKAVTTTEPTEENTMNENEEEHAANINIAVQQLSESTDSVSTDSSRRHTISSFDAGITTTALSLISPIPEVMADFEDEDDDNDDEKQLNSNICSVSEEDESGWSSTIDKSYNSDEDGISIGNKSRRSIQGLESSNNKSSILLGEGCLIAMEKYNGYTVLETEYKIQEKLQQKVVDHYRLAVTTLSNNQEGREDIDSLVLSSDDTSNTKFTAEYRTHPDYSYSDDDNEDDDNRETGATPPKSNNDSNIDCILVDNNGFHPLRKDTIDIDNGDDDDTTHESSTTTRTSTE